jgi:hypothetical protein
MVHRTTKTAPIYLILDIINVPVGLGLVYVILASAHHLHLPEYVLGAISGAISSHFENGSSEKTCVAFSLLCLRSRRVVVGCKLGVQVWRRTAWIQMTQTAFAAPISILALFFPHKGSVRGSTAGGSATRQPEASSRPSHL